MPRRKGVVKSKRSSQPKRAANPADRRRKETTKLSQRPARSRKASPLQ